jgi:hypothetical protein
VEQTTTTTHDLHPVRVKVSPYIGHAELYAQACTCGWSSKWYVHRGNATKRALAHQQVSQ